MTQEAKVLEAAILDVSTQNMAIVAMLRALYTHHPARESVKATFEALIAQNLAHPACLDRPDRAKMLREMAEILTRPSIDLH